MHNHAMTRTDHDLLIELKSKMDDLKIDIRDIKDNTSARLAAVEEKKLNIADSYPVLYKAALEKTLTDQETRLRSAEHSITQIITYGSALMILLGIVQFVIGKFWN